MIELFNLVKIDKIKGIQDRISNIVFIGNTNTYYKYRDNGIKGLKYIPFKNMAIFSENEEFFEIQKEVYNFSNSMGIETEVYEDIEEFIDCINLDETLESILVFTKNQNTIDDVRNKIKNKKIYINKNPFKDEKFKLSMEIA